MWNRDDVKWLFIVELTDPRCYQSRSIDLLSEADVFFEIFDDSQLKSPTSKLVVPSNYTLSTALT